MKRYIKYIFLSLLTCFLASSCIEEIAAPQPETGSELATLVPRVKSFTNQYVTKAYGSREDDIFNLSVLVFGTDGKLIHLQESNGASLTLNKSMLNGITSAANLESATIVMFANISLSDIVDSDGESIEDNKATLTLENLADYTCSLSNPVITAIPDGFGFPMMGKRESVNLSSTNTQQSAIDVSLKILYAKVNFEIGVAEGTENNMLNENYGTFSLTGYSVNDVATDLMLEIPEGATVSADYTSSGAVEKTGTANLSGTKTSFTFYVAENRYIHNCDLSAIYPDPDATDSTNPWLTTTDYDHLKQQYKPAIAEASTADGNPTYVVVSGSYIDYRGTSWNVNYTIYLGKDNHSNFEVDRNSEYTNILTIKGIRNNNSYGDGDVWIDHRVDVQLGNNQGADDCVTITRETLIDSHIEVRPLRVSWSGTNYTFARIYMPYYTENNGETWSQRDETSSKKNWIGIELNDKTGSLYCSANNETTKGKRKYFTDALISELNTQSINTDIVAESGQDMFIALNNNECAWIYIDEYIYPESSTTVATSDRTAKIVVDFCTMSNEGVLTVNSREEYILYQQPLINIDNKYYVENYEEYLHSYDSHDNYNLVTSPTDYTGQGLQWGKSNRMSKSQFVTKKLVADWSDWAPTNNEAYDFLHATDAASESLSEFVFVDKSGVSVDLSQNTGVGFTYLASENNGITISSMGEMPENAYQYCLSKNKFIEGTDGESHKMKVSWYVPDVYELSEIFESSHSPLSNDSFYWSSQVPYDITQSNLLSATIASERVSEARVVSNEGGIGTKPRPEKHRIRCLYSLNAQEADMTNRTPEGIGGLIKIPMTVANDGFFDYDDWFAEVTGKTDEFPNTDYRFPKGDTYSSAEASTSTEADSDFGGILIDGVHYYSKDPLNERTWDPYNLKSYGYDGYYTLVHNDKWPGLTQKVTEPVTSSSFLEWVANQLGISSICTISGTDKKITKTVTTRSGSKIDGIPDNVSSVPLDHNEDTKENLTISFGSGTNNSNSPNYQYYYEDASVAHQEVWKKDWVVPTYSTATFSGQKQTYPAPPQQVTFDERDVLIQINTAINGLISGSLLESERCAYLDHQYTSITNSTYYYTSADNAKTAAENYFKNTINAAGEYLSNPSISTSSQNIQLCAYTYRYQKEKRDWIVSGFLGLGSHWGDWYDNGIGEGSGTLSGRRYTYVITYQKPDGTYYRYEAGSGGWGEEVLESSTSIAVEKSADALTFYAGNTFTITAKPGYYIRSVKVNYNTSTLTEGTKYLRFVNNALDLPGENEEPDQMMYLDGANGWSKWTSEDQESSVTLRLVICNKNTNSWWIGNWGDPQMTHSDPRSSSERGYNLVINSLEIRAEQNKDSSSQD